MPTAEIFDHTAQKLGMTCAGGSHAYEKQKIVTILETIVLTLCTVDVPIKAVFHSELFPAQMENSCELFEIVQKKVQHC